MNLKSNFNFRSIFSNSTWLLVDKFYTLILGLIITSLLARTFGPSVFGVYNYAFAFVSLFTIISTLGLDTILVKSIVEKTYNKETILGTSIVLRVIGGLLLTIVSVCLIFLIEPTDTSLQILVSIISITMIVKAYEIFEYYFQAIHKTKIPTLAKMVVITSSTIFKVYFLLNGISIINFSILLIIEAFLMAIALFIAYKIVDNKKSKFKFELAYAKYALGQSIYLIIAGLMISIYMRVDQVMLGRLSNSSEVGLYSAAVKIAEMWYFIPLAIIAAFRPVIMNKKSESLEAYNNILRTLFQVIIVLSLSVGIGVTLLDNYIIQFIYGKDFLDASNILSINIWAGTFAMLGAARSIWLLTEGLQKYTLIYTSVGLIINVILNLLLIPKYGALGAAIGTVVAQFSNIIVLIFFKKTKEISITIFKSFNLLSILEAAKKISK